MRKRLFLICGPSGVGKSTLVKWVLARVPEWVFIQKVVTRQLRAGEIEGPEILTVPRIRFEGMAASGEVVAVYQRYGEHYGMLAKMGGYAVGCQRQTAVINGLDRLDNSPGLTIGDAYEAPGALRRLEPTTVVILLHAPLMTVVRRIWRKGLSQEERETRLKAVTEEYASGFPEDVPIVDHHLSTDGDIEKVGSSILRILRSY